MILTHRLKNRKFLHGVFINNGVTMCKSVVYDFLKPENSQPGISRMVLEPGQGNQLILGLLGMLFYRFPETPRRGQRHNFLITDNIDFCKTVKSRKRNFSLLFEKRQVLPSLVNFAAGVGADILISKGFSDILDILFNLICQDIFGPACLPNFDVNELLFLGPNYFDDTF